MENEIKVNEYIRTDDGRIYKLEYLEDEVFLSDKFYNNIVKHSSNLIDLIQEGDILRIRMQFHHKIDPIYTLREIASKENAEWKNILEQIDLCHYEVVEIYTKEMIESISYKVKEK